MVYRFEWVIFEEIANFGSINFYKKVYLNEKYSRKSKQILKSYLFCHILSYYKYNGPMFKALCYCKMRLKQARWSQNIARIVVFLNVNE